MALDDAGTLAAAQPIDPRFLILARLFSGGIPTQPASPGTPPAAPAGMTSASSPASRSKSPATRAKQPASSPRGRTAGGNVPEANAQPIIVDPLELGKPPARPLAQPTGAERPITIDPLQLKAAQATAQDQPVIIDPLDLTANNPPSPEVPHQPAATKIPAPSLAARVGRFVPEWTVPALAAAKKYAVDPFERMSAAGAKAGGQMLEETYAAVRHPETVAGMPSAKTPEIPGVTYDPNIVAETEKQEPIATGIAKGVGELGGGIVADPRMWVLGLGNVGSAAFKRLMSAGFSTQMLYGAVAAVPEIRKAIESGDVHSAARLITMAGLSGALGTLSGAHAVKGEPPVERAALPAANEQPALPAGEPRAPGRPMPKQTPTVIPPSGETIAAPGAPQPALGPGRETRALPPAPKSVTGEELQSFAGPGEKAIQLPERTPTTIPPGGKAIPAGPTTIDPRELTRGRGNGKPTATAKAEAAPAPAATLQDKKLQLAELDKKYRALDERLRSARSYEVTRSITSKMRPLSEQRRALRAEIEEIEPRPAAKPLSRAVEDEKFGPRIGGESLTHAQPRPQESTAEAKATKTPTYDKLPQEMRDAVDAIAESHGHQPQSLQDATEADLKRLSIPGTPMKEQFARLVAHDAGMKLEPQEGAPANALDLIRALEGKPAAKPEAGISPEAMKNLLRAPTDQARLEGLDAETKALQARLRTGAGSPEDRRAAERRILENEELAREFGERRQAERRAEEPTAPLPAELRGATREGGAAGRVAKARGEVSARTMLLGKASSLHTGIDPTMVTDLFDRLNRAYQEHVADPAIEKLGLGRTHKDVEAVDPKLASRIRRYEAAPQYFRTKAEDIAQDITKGLSREQERLLSLMADQQSRDNLQLNHPKEYAAALADKDVQAALDRYRPYGEALTKAHAILGGSVMPGDHLPWVYPEHVSGMGQRVAETDTARTGFDRGVTPQRADQFGRTTTAEYHYKNGLHEFGPAFARKFSRTMTKLAEHATAMDFMSKSTVIEPGDRLPPVITYNGKTFYSPEVLQMIREAKPGKASEALAESLGVKTLPTPKNAEAYAQYRPTGGKDTPSYLGPRAVVQALKALADSDPGKMGPVGRFLQEQVIGMGLGVRHGFNLFRRITHAFPLGTSSPVNWIRAVRVMTDRGLRERALSRTNDPSYDALLRWGGISPEGASHFKEYQGGNLNPANWLRVFAKVGNRWLFEPGGVDQKARLWMRDLLKSQRPELTDDRAAQLIRDQLGNYSRQNWTKNQKLLSHLLLFPGWDFSSINWVIRHPIKTAVPPAILTMLANQAIHQSGGKQEPGDQWDPFAIHARGHAYGTAALEEPLARAGLKPFGRAVQARLEGETGRQAISEGARAVPQALAGFAGMTRPDLALPFELAAGKTRFGRDIVAQGDFTRRGTLLPSKGAEDIGAHILKAFFPPIQRATEENQSATDALVSNFGVNRYEQQPRRAPRSERQQDVANVKQDILALERQAAAIAQDRSLSPDEKQRRLLPLRRKFQELVKQDRPN